MSVGEGREEVHGALGVDLGSVPSPSSGEEAFSVDFEIEISFSSEGEGGESEEFIVRGSIYLTLLLE